MTAFDPSLEPRDFDQPKTVSGFAVALTTALPVGAAAIVSGAATAAVGKTFELGAGTVNHLGVDAVNSIIEFADKHNEALVVGAATGAATAVATAMLDKSSGNIGVKLAKAAAAGIFGALAGIAVKSGVTPTRDPSQF